MHSKTIQYGKILGRQLKRKSSKDGKQHQPIFNLQKVKRIRIALGFRLDSAKKKKYVKRQDSLTPCITVVRENCGKTDLNPRKTGRRGCARVATPKKTTRLTILFQFSVSVSRFISKSGRIQKNYFLGGGKKKIQYEI